MSDYAMFRKMLYGMLAGIAALVTPAIALFALVFLVPSIAGAQGVGDLITAANSTAGAIEKVADNSLVRMLVLAIIIAAVALAVQSAVIYRMLVNQYRIITNVLGKPCLQETERGEAVMRDFLREVWRDLKVREFNK